MNKELHDALVAGNVDHVQHLIEHEEVDLSERWSDETALNQTALHLAVCHNHPPMVTLLLEHNAQPNETDAQGMAPLHLAARLGHDEVARCFLAHSGTEPNVLSLYGKITPLHLAAYHGHAKVAEALFQMSCDVNQRANFQNMPRQYEAASEEERFFSAYRNHASPLLWAAGKGHLDVVKMLCKHTETDYDALDEQGGNALYWAVCGGSFEVTQYLLQRTNMDRNVATHDGTPLHVAAFNGKSALVRCLLQEPPVRINARVCLSEKDKQRHPDWQDGHTALHAVCSTCYCSPGHVAVLDLLLKAPEVAINAQNDKGNTPLHLCVMNIYDPLTQEFTQTRDPSLKSKFFYMATLLLEAGADPCIKNKEGQSILALLPPSESHAFLSHATSSCRDHTLSEQLVLFFTTRIQTPTPPRTFVSSGGLQDSGSDAVTPYDERSFQRNRP